MTKRFIKYFIRFRQFYETKVLVTHVETYNVYLWKGNLKDLLITQVIAFVLAILVIWGTLYFFVPDPVEQYLKDHKTH